MSCYQRCGKREGFTWGQRKWRALNGERWPEQAGKSSQWLEDGWDDDQPTDLGASRAGNSGGQELPSGAQQACNPAPVNFRWQLLQCVQPRS